MTSSTPSDSRGAGFARHRGDGRRLPLAGSAADDAAPRGGVSITDMPSPKPQVRRRPIKGLPGPSGSGDPDYSPGGGAWRSVW